MRSSKHCKTSQVSLTAKFPLQGNYVELQQWGPSGTFDRPSCSASFSGTSYLQQCTQLSHSALRLRLWQPFCRHTQATMTQQAQLYLYLCQQAATLLLLCQQTIISLTSCQQAATLPTPRHLAANFLTLCQQAVSLLILRQLPTRQRCHS